MAEVPFVVNRKTVTCLQWVRENPGQFRHVMLAAAIIGGVTGALSLSGIYEWDRYIDSIRPVPPSLESVIVSSRDEYGSVRVLIKYKTTPTKECIRIGSHMMMPRDIDIKDPEIDLMSGSVAGEGYSGVVTNDRFTLGFYYPSSVPGGEYSYKYTRFMQCNPFRLVPFQDEVKGSFVIPPLERKL